ncbi:MAG: hypothetical protein ONB48_15665 [candidate division KSB1 bacterium]|nr:hypothetical protein [candidate division KSB1 bacterium]MDZ7296991.1 hypothetical protein [candidate division KSB1 bacterium]MDZ7306179.1 hypothetical protein [candidate division KSB1 bacterium]MDZ7347858.1 hypothetical protein [candidate division KSB1 bacterium]MDZ7352163.1 hypothetical protein [candidate division KSB1 bacterium]
MRHAMEWFQTAHPSNDNDIAIFDPWLLVIVLACLTSFLLGLLWQRHRSGVKAARSSQASWQRTLLPYGKSLTRMVAELERARRYHRTLTLTVLVVDYEGGKLRRRGFSTLLGDTGLASQLLLSLISSLLRENMRSSDIVTYNVTEDRYLILSPESSLASAEQAVARLLHLISNRTKITLRFGIAEFPADGLILSDLVARAHARSQRKAADHPPQTDGAQSSQGVQRTEPLVSSLK